jgi:hypothetical protein
MELQGSIDAGLGTIGIVPQSSGRPIDLGIDGGNALSLTQAEIDTLRTSGRMHFGSFTAGPVAVNATFNSGLTGLTLHSGSTITTNVPINLGGSFGTSSAAFTANAAVSVGGNLSLSGGDLTFHAPLTVGGNALLSGTTIATTAPIKAGGNLAEIANTISMGAATHVGGTMDVYAKSVIVGGPIDAQRVSFSADALIFADTVTAATSIEIASKEFGSIEIAAAAGPNNKLYLVSSQVNSLLKSPTLRLGDLAPPWPGMPRASTLDIRINDALVPVGPNAPGNVVLQTAEFGSTRIDVNAPIATSTPGDIVLSSRAVSVNAGGSLKTHSGSISICCGNTIIAAPVTANGGSIEITANALNTSEALLATGGGIALVANSHGIGAPVQSTSPDGDIDIRPNGLATYYTLTPEFLSRFRPGSGMLRIGDLSFTRDISVFGHLTDPGAQGLTTLSLIAGNGNVTQAPGSVISVPNLAVRAGGSIVLNGNNLASTVSLQSGNLGLVNYVYAGDGPLTVGNVDPLFVAPGVFAGGNGVVLRSNELSINENVTGNTVGLVPRTWGTPVTLGTKPGTGALGLTAEELSRIHAFTLGVGDAGTGNVTVTAPITGSLSTFSNLLVETLPSSSFTVNASSPVTVPGNFGVLTGTVTTNSTVSSVNGNVGMFADAMTFNAGVNANASTGTIFLGPRSESMAIDLGGADIVSVNRTLGLDAADIGNLHSSNLEIGNNLTKSIAVSAPVRLDVSSAKLTARFGATITVDSLLDNTGDLTLAGAGNVGVTVNGKLGSTEGALSVGGFSITNDGALSSAGDLALSAGAILANGTVSSGGNLALTANFHGSITANGALSALGTTTLMADTIAISGGNVSGSNVTLSVADSGRIVNLGTMTAEAAFALDQAALDRITTPGTLTIRAGVLNVTGPVSFTRISNLALRANTMDVAPAGSVVMNGPGDVISVAPWFFNNPVRLGGPGGLGGLELSDAEIDRFIVPNGVLRLGDVETAKQIRIEGPVTIDPEKVKTLTLAAAGGVGGGITQTANSTITVNNLRLLTTGAIDLTQNNAVGTLAGGNSGSSYDFTNAGILAVGGMVDGISGLQGGKLTLRSDDLVLTGPGTISTSSATLMPRNAGAGMDLGSNPGSTYGVDAVEMAQITSFDLMFGSNTAGPVTVSAPMERAFGTLGVLTSPTQNVDVNGAFAGPSGVQIDAGTINVSQPISSTFGPVVLTARAPTTLTINAPVTAGTSVGLNSDTTNIAAAVTGGTVSIAPVTIGRPTSLGVESATALSLTQAELAFIRTSSLTIGGSTVLSPTSGPMTIGAPLDLNVDSLNLTSTGTITQDVGAPIRLTRVDASGERIGNLDVRNFGTGNGNASIFLPAANEVPGTLSFATRGTNNDFDFVGALAPQSVVNNGVSGQVRIVILPPMLPMPSLPSGTVTIPTAVLEDQALTIFQQVFSATDTIASINHALPVISEAGTKSVEDEEKKQQEGK